METGTPLTVRFAFSSHEYVARGRRADVAALNSTLISTAAAAAAAGPHQPDVNGPLALHGGAIDLDRKGLII